MFFLEQKTSVDSGGRHEGPGGYGSEKSEVSGAEQNSIPACIWACRVA